MSGGSSIKSLDKEGDLDYFRLFPGHFDRKFWEVNFFNGLLAKLTHHPYMIKRIPGPPLHTRHTTSQCNHIAGSISHQSNMDGFEELEWMFGLIMIHDVS